MATVRPSIFERLLDEIPFVEKELLLLGRLVTPGAVCVDVGAAGGLHALVMARAAGPLGHVIAVEARPGSARLVRWLATLAGVGRRVRVHAVALADRAGQLPLRIPLVPTRAHAHETREARRHAAFARLPSRTITVPTTTLDQLVADDGTTHVDVLKCDVEGAELAVLAGANQTLDTMRPIVIVEADDVHQRRMSATAQRVVDAVRAHSYTAWRYARGRLWPVDTVTEDEDDYVLIPAERGVPAALRGSERPSA